MKRIITICLLVVTLLAGAVSMEAKTTKKRSKARTTQTTSNSNDTFTKKYKGNIGPYDVVVTLTYYDYFYDSYARTKNWNVKGSYVYTAAGNRLNLDGGWSNLGAPRLWLTEYTPKGKKTAVWNLEPVTEAGDAWFGAFKGQFDNLTNGKTYNVYLRAIN